MNQIKLLQNYNYVCMRIEEVNKEIIRYNQLIESTRTANMAINYEQERVSETFKTSDITYQAVEKIIDIYASEIAKWENKLDELLKQKQQVENILDNLSSTERKIIELRYIKNLRWGQVAESMDYSERHCRRLSQKTLKRIGG